MVPFNLQDVRFIRLRNVEENKLLNYRCGDVAVLRPQNRRQSVNHLMSVLGPTGLNPDTVIKVKQRDPDMPVPKVLEPPTSLHNLALSYWDLNVSSIIQLKPIKDYSNFSN